MQIFNNIETNITEGIQIKDICQTKEITISFEILAPGERQKKHVHRLIDEMYFVLEGKGFCYVNDDGIVIQKGDLILIEPNDIHFLVNESESCLKLLLISRRTKIQDIVTIE